MLAAVLIFYCDIKNYHKLSGNYEEERGKRKVVITKRKY